jgi:hypothetical protein
MRMLWLWIVPVLCCGAAIAQTSAPAPGAPSLAERAARRFPQPVVVGDLIGHDVLEPTEAQHVLGRVKSVVRRKDGSLDMIITTGGVLGIGARPVAVPIDAMALLGEFVAVMEFSPEQLQAFRTDDGGSDFAILLHETIRVGIVGPFH